MSWVVTIPSYRRAEVLNSQTLRCLAEGGVPRDRIHIGVAEEEWFEYYNVLDPALYGELHSHNFPGQFARTQAFLQAMFVPGKEVSFDDDVRRLDRKVDDKTLEPITDLPAFFDEAFAECERVGATLWGIYPVRNALFMKHRIRYDLTLCVGHTWGHITSGRVCEEQWSDFANDYERSLKCFMADGIIVRYDNVAALSKVYNQPGGLQGIRSPENKQDDIDMLMRDFPGLVKVKKTKGDMPEIRLVQPR